jgi:two-component system OmpR family response regulator
MNAREKREQEGDIMSQAAKIMVVDDEAAIRFYLKEALERKDYQVVAVESGEAALECINGECFDLALIDLKLKGMDGIALLKALRHKLPDLAIIVLTAHASVETAVEALRQGAHDYLFKPCKTAELCESVASGLMKRQRELRQRSLLAKLESDLSSNLEELRSAVVQETAPPLKQDQQAEVEDDDANCIFWKDLAVDFKRHEIRLDDQRLDLSPTQFSVLAYLAAEAPRVVSAQELMSEVQGYQSEPWEENNPIRYHIYRIRKKISEATGREDVIHTVRGVGYKLDD